MWLIEISLAAILVTAIWYAKDDGKLKLNLLGLMLWGAAIMIFVDHIMGYLMEGGEFIEMTADATLLGVGLIIIASAIWQAILLAEDPAGKIWRKTEA